MKNKITKKTTLSKILEIPGAEKVLAKHRVPCIRCPFGSQEMSHLEVGQVAEMYDIKIKELLEDLNKLLQSNSKEK